MEASRLVDAAGGARPLDIEACVHLHTLVDRRKTAHGTNTNTNTFLTFEQLRARVQAAAALCVDVGEHHFAQGETTEACTEFARALDVDPTLVASMDVYAVALMLEGDVDTLNSLYTRLQTSHPGRVETRIAALALLQASDASRARTLITATEDAARESLGSRKRKAASPARTQGDSLVQPPRYPDDNPFLTPGKTKWRKLGEGRARSEGTVAVDAVREGNGQMANGDQMLRTSIIYETGGNTVPNSNDAGCEPVGNEDYSRIEDNECFILLRARNAMFEENIKAAIKDFKKLTTTAKGCIYGYEGLVASFLEIEETDKALQYAGEIGKAMANNPRVMIFAAKVLDKVSQQDTSEFAATLLSSAITSGNSKIHWAMQKALLLSCNRLAQSQLKTFDDFVSSAPRKDTGAEEYEELKLVQHKIGIMDGILEVPMLSSQRELHKLKRAQEETTGIPNSKSGFTLDDGLDITLLQTAGLPLNYQHLSEKAKLTQKSKLVSALITDGWTPLERELLAQENGELRDVYEMHNSSIPIELLKGAPDYNSKLVDEFELISEEPLTLTRDSAVGIGLGGIGVGVFGGFPANRGLTLVPEEDTDLQKELAFNNVNTDDPSISKERIKPGTCSNSNIIESVLTLTQIYEGEGNLLKSRKLLENVLMVIPSPILHLRLAEILMELGENALAFNEINTAFIMDPENEIVQELFSRILATIEETGAQLETVNQHKEFMKGKNVDILEEMDIGIDI